MHRHVHVYRHVCAPRVHEVGWAFLQDVVLCADMCMGLCMNIYADMSIGMCMNICADMCMDLCMNMCVDKCRCAHRYVNKRAYKHVSKMCT